MKTGETVKLQTLDVGMNNIKLSERQAQLLDEVISEEIKTVKGLVDMNKPGVLYGDSFIYEQMRARLNELEELQEKMQELM